MANYSLIINSRFKPFTYQELLAPAMQMTQAHQAVEEAYADLQTKASIWDKMANETTDPKAHAAYQKYADDLERYASDLSKYGLNATSRRDMFNMRARYAKDITPIENAYKKREEQAKEQRVALMNNPTLLLSRRASQTSLDDYIDNPNLDYEAYSGAMLTQQVAQQAQAIAKDLRSAQIEGKVDAYTNAFVTRYGVAPQDVLRAIQNPNDPNSNKILGQMVDSAIASSGIANWADQKTLDQARAFAVQGLWSGVGQTQVAPIENFGAREGLKHKYEMEKQRQAQAAAAAEAERKRRFEASENAKNRAHDLTKARITAGETTGQTTHIASRAVPLYSKQSMNKANAEIEDNIRNGYLTRTSSGGLSITPKGIKEARRMINLSSTQVGYVPDMATMNKKGAKPVAKQIHSNFYNFLTGTVGLKESDLKSVTRNVAPTNAYNVVTKYINKGLNRYSSKFNGTNYDAYMSTGLKEKVETEDTRGMLLNSMGSNGLDIVDFKGQTGFKPTGKLSYKDLDEMDLRAIHRVSTNYGTVYELTPKNGEGVITVGAPGKVRVGAKIVYGGAANPNTEANALRATADAINYSRALNSGYDYKIDNNGNYVYDEYGNAELDYNKPLTPQRALSYQEGLQNALDEQGMYNNSTEWMSKTKDEEFTTVSGR